MVATALFFARQPLGPPGRFDTKEDRGPSRCLKAIARGALRQAANPTRCEDVESSRTPARLQPRRPHSSSRNLTRWVRQTMSEMQLNICRRSVLVWAQLDGVHRGRIA